MNRTPIRPDSLLLGDCVEWLQKFPDNTFTAVITDPPYGLEFMGKEWDAPWKQSDVSKANRGTLTNMVNPDGSRKFNMPAPAFDLSVQAARGFQEWTTKWSVEVLRVLKPGGHLLSFAGTRTYHRMTCGIEEAGFQIRDKLDFYCEMVGYHSWAYGSGFPKSLNISKAIDKSAGVDFEASPASGVGFMNPEGKGGYNVTKNKMERAGESTDEAKKWEGYGTALKPAHEPIADFSKQGEPLQTDVPFQYIPKVAARERNKGCKKLFWKMGGEGKDFERVEEDEYKRLKAENDENKGKEGWTPHHVARGNVWPTVKPIELVRYLVRLVKMPGDNLILDPFMGSGTTPIGCILEGCNYIGIDKDPVAFEIAAARIHYFQCLGKKGLE